MGSSSSAPQQPAVPAPGPSSQPTSPPPQRIPKPDPVPQRATRPPASQLAANSGLPPPRTGPCDICGDVSPLFCLPVCKHPPSSCRGCVAEHVAVLLRSGVSRLTCPASRCGMVIDDAMLQDLVPRSVFVTYSELKLKELLAEDSSVIYCSNAACGAALAVAEGSGDIIRCTACRSQTCFTCQRPWHAGITCEELQAIVALENAPNESENAAYLREHTRTCPRPTCQFGPCYKEEGECDASTCPKCRFRFCWRCGADQDLIYRTDCKSHQPACRYYC